MTGNTPLGSRLKLFSMEALAVALVFLVALPVFVFLTHGILINKPFGFDNAVFDWIKPHISEAHTRTIRIVTLLASGYVLAPANVALLIYFLFTRHSLYMIKVPAICLVGYLFNELLKQLFSHPRPLHPVYEAARGFSFPSGHALSAVVFYGMFIYIVWKEQNSFAVRMAITIVLLGVILLIGFTRVYLRVHYASDVLAGFSMGAMVLFAAILVTDGIERRFKKTEPKSRL